MKAISNISPENLIALGHKAAATIETDYPLESDVMREIATRFDVLKEVHQQTQKQRDDLADDAEYLKMRFKEVDLLFGRLMLAMRAAVIEYATDSGSRSTNNLDRARGYSDAKK